MTISLRRILVSDSEQITDYATKKLAREANPGLSHNTLTSCLADPENSEWGGYRWVVLVSSSTFVSLEE